MRGPINPLLIFKFLFYFIFSTALLAKKKEKTCRGLKILHVKSCVKNLLCQKLFGNLGFLWSKKVQFLKQKWQLPFFLAIFDTEK